MAGQETRSSTVGWSLPCPSGAVVDKAQPERVDNRLYSKHGFIAFSEAYFCGMWLNVVLSDIFGPASVHWKRKCLQFHIWFMRSTLCFWFAFDLWDFSDFDVRDSPHLSINIFARMGAHHSSSSLTRYGKLVRPRATDITRGLLKWLIVEIRTGRYEGFMFE